MPGKPFAKKDDDSSSSKGFAPAQKGNLAPPFAKKSAAKKFGAARSLSKGRR